MCDSNYFQHCSTYLMKYFTEAHRKALRSRSTCANLKYSRVNYLLQYFEPLRLTFKSLAALMSDLSSKNMEISAAGEHTGLVQATAFTRGGGEHHYTVKRCRPKRRRVSFSFTPVKICRVLLAAVMFFLSTSTVAHQEQQPRLRMGYHPSTHTRQ